MMKYLFSITLLLILKSVFCAHAQAPVQTAKDYIRPYNEYFQYGTNLGYYNSNWSDENLAAAGQSLGGHSIRPTLPESFVESYGYNIRVPAFTAYVNTYGMKELTCFVEGPSAAHRDPQTYPGCTSPSNLFAHLYEPIWNPDGSVNANNYYAIYLYKLLQIYGDKVRFWEVVNEPDFTTNQADMNAWRTRAPNPGELANLQAPIYNYIRMLRISYEVVKRYHPEAYVTTGGVGYSQFVDALLRYTDNPNGGAATAQYPHTAGAYLDALSFHSYPAYSLHYYDNALGGFRYTRTSDYSAEKVIADRDSMVAALRRGGYGSTYPAKYLLLSETNIGRRTSDDRTGSDEMQRNFGIKALVLAQKNDIKQLYMYQLGESADAPPAGTPVSGNDELALMGLFENLKRDAPGAQRATPLGQAFATTSKLLYGYSYDAARTAALALPNGVNGAAFNKNGRYAYVLWAKALVDNSEVASATYSFPAVCNLAAVQRYEWNYASDSSAKATLPSQNIALSGTPAFFSESNGAAVITSVNPTSAAAGASVTVTGNNFTGATSVRFNGTAATTFSVNNASTITVTVPSMATTGNVTVTTPSGTSNGVRFVVLVAPVLTGLSPTSGPQSTLVTLTGTDFTGATDVRFGPASFNFPAAFTVVSATTLTARVPAGVNAGPNNVTVMTPSGTSNTQSFTVAAITVATVTTATPASVAPISATLGGNATADGGATVTERGVVYVVGAGTPTPADTKVIIGSGTGAFSQSVTGLTASTQYTVRAYATNSAGTSYGTSQSFTTTAALGASISSQTNVGCNGGSNGSATTTAMGGTAPYTYSWSPSGGTAATATGLSAGTYTVTITDASSQTTTATAAITQPTALASSVNSQTNVTTNGGRNGAATVSVSGGTAPYTYSWSPSGGTAATATGLSAGTYTVTITDANACTTARNATITPPAPADLTISTGSAASPTPIAAGTYNNITVTVTGFAQLGGAVVVNGAFTVQSGGLDANCQILTGAGSFTLGAGGVLGICHAAGIASSGPTGSVQVTGTRSFSTGASYGYTGAAAATGTGLPGTVLNLALNTAGNVTLTAPVAVTAALGVNGAGNLVLNGNGLTLLSSASGTALVVNSGTGVVVGSATVQRYIDPSLNAGLGYRHYAAPVSNSTVADLATTGFAPEVGQAATYNASPTPGATAPFPTVFGYDQARVMLANAYAPFDRGFVVPASPAAPLVVGQGYAVNIAGTQLVDFVGSLTSGDQAPLALARAAGNADAGWQLLGNPYPAPLDYSRVAPADRTNLDGAIYVYSSTGKYVGQYRAYVNGVGGNPVLPVAQGFFARVSAGQPSGSLTFRNAQRLTAPTATPFQRGTADTRPLVQLALHGASGPADALYAYAQPGATPAFDPQFDAEKLANPSGLNLSSAAASGQRLAVDGRPAFDAATALPLTVGVPAAGSYTLTAVALNNLPAGLDAYLSDAQTGRTVNLRTQPSYAFAVTAVQATALLAGRFALRFTAGALATAPALTAAQVELFPNPACARFAVLVPGVAGASAVQAELVNGLGQVVRRQAAALPAGGATLTVETAELAAGVYTLRLRAGPAALAKRVVIQ